jgi:hypothetical protein
MRENLLDECGATQVDHHDNHTVVVAANIKDGVRVRIVSTVESVFEFMEVLRFSFG